MSKLIGYVPMKQREGLVIYLTEKGRGNVQGEMAITEFIYDAEIMKKFTPSTIGKEISLSYGRGYNGKAYIADVDIKLN